MPSCARSGAAEGRFSRFDADVRIEGAGRATGTLDLVLRPLRGRDGWVAFIVADSAERMFCGCVARVTRA